MPDLKTCRDCVEDLFGDTLFNTDDVVFHGTEEEILARVAELTNDMIEAALEGEYNLCDEINQTIDELMLSVDGGDLI